MSCYSDFLLHTYKKKHQNTNICLAFQFRSYELAVAKCACFVIVSRRYFVTHAHLYFGKSCLPHAALKSDNLLYECQFVITHRLFYQLIQIQGPLPDQALKLNHIFSVSSPDPVCPQWNTNVYDSINRRYIVFALALLRCAHNFCYPMIPVWQTQYVTGSSFVHTTGRWYC